MNVVFHCLGLPFNGDSVYKGSLGGSETACWAMARELAKIGHSVSVFTLGEPGEFEGVTYDHVGPITEQAPLGEAFTHYATNAPIDVLVIQRHPAAYALRFNSKLNFLWLHDIAQKAQGPMIGGCLWQIDGIFTVSDYHKRQVVKAYDLPEEAVIATRNGLNLDWFEGEPDEERTPHTLLYSSRPERGLEHLIKPGGIMDQLKEKRPDIPWQLGICGYIDPPQAQGMEGYYQGLLDMIGKRHDCRQMGHLTKAQLYNLMKTTWVHAYPTEFPEVSCITAMETQAAGLPIVTTDRTALPETLQGAGAVIVPLRDGAVNEEAFTDALIELADHPKKHDKLVAQCARKAPQYDWALVARDWDELMREKLEKRSTGSLYALARHYVKYDDIMAFRHLRERVNAGKMFPGETFPEDLSAWVDKRFGAWTEPGNVDEYRQMYAEYYQYEFDSDHRPFVQHMTDDARVLALANLMKALPEGSKVLDIGCAEGSFTMGLAEAMPHVQFISVEPEKNNRETFREALAKSDIQNIELYEGDDYNLPKEAVGCAAIVACEILEHVPDQSAFIDRLAEHVGGKPLFALTTPYGPWQWEIKGEELVRVHLHHLERADIKELAGHLPEFAMRTVPSQQPVGLPFVVGTHPWRFKWTGPGCLGEIDYMRKHREQAPMGTLALCMIARNAEHRIGAAIESLRDVASEVWVAIDETTTDDTKAVAEKCGAKTFSIPSPLDIGFAAARNLSIEKATTQWIMWLDCDEELVAPDRIYKYLRDSAITGIGVPQHHFSVDPPGVQKTDYPCRIFRHNEGMEFHGFVHEHPELVFNEGPGRVIQAMDLAITHPSYIDEAARRGRFSRNLPLMERDRRENPTRKLGHFLWLRDTSYILHEAQMRGDRDAAAHAAEEGEKAWQAIVDDGNIRLILDGLQYRSNHLELLRKGFWFSADIHGIRLEGPPAEGADGVTYPMRAKFADQDELHKILGMILSDRLEAFEQEEL